MKIFICLIIGYLLGSILPAVIISWIKTGRDISQIGSGNPGMANVMSGIGKLEGILTLAGDILKVLLAFFFAWVITGGRDLQTVILWTGFGSILGHDFPAWRRFRGGKGVTVTCVWLVFLMPLWGSVSCAAGGAVTLLTGYLPVGGILIPVLAIPFAFLFCDIWAGVLVTVSAAIMVQRHWQGIMRIRDGLEKRRFRHEKR